MKVWAVLGVRKAFSKPDELPGEQHDLLLNSGLNRMADSGGPTVRTRSKSGLQRLAPRRHDPRVDYRVRPKILPEIGLSLLINLSLVPN